MDRRQIELKNKLDGIHTGFTQLPLFDSYHMQRLWRAPCFFREEKHFFKRQSIHIFDQASSLLLQCNFKVEDNPSFFYTCLL